MKKLLFAIAGAAAFSAFAADPAAGANDISIVGFENYTADQTVIGYGDDGQSGGTLWSCAGDDASLVKTLGGDNAAVPAITEPRPFAGETNTKYLALDTNGSELQRAIPAAGQAVAADGTYIDTLVQFTPSESAPTPTDLDGAKLAIWLSSEGGVTNLMVAGGFYTHEGLSAETDPQVVATNYTLSGTYEPGTWYRLTVKAIASLSDDPSYRFPGFQISIDGTPLTTVEAAYDADALSWLTDPFEDEGTGEQVYTVTPEKAVLLTGKTFIPSADANRAATLTAVGFKGTGALDDFVVTTAEPSFAPAAISLTLTWTPAEVTAVSYVLESDPATTNVVTSGTAVAIPAANIGTNVTLIATFASGYVFDYLDIGGYQLQSLTFPVPNVSTNATLVAKVAPTLPTYIDSSDAAITAAYDAWKTAYAADADSSKEAQFVLNVDPATTVPADALEITAIEQNETAGWDITVECTMSGVDLSGTTGTARVNNGYLAVSYTDDLGGTWTTENIAITASANGKVTVNVNKSGAKFMKVKLSAAAEPAAQN